jgi:hypothetical protein
MMIKMWYKLNIQYVGARLLVYHHHFSYNQLSEVFISSGFMYTFAEFILVWVPFAWAQRFWARKPAEKEYVTHFQS